MAYPAVAMSCDVFMMFETLLGDRYPHTSSHVEMSESTAGNNLPTQD